MTVIRPLSGGLSMQTTMAEDPNGEKTNHSLKDMYRLINHDAKLPKLHY
jgi:hypothetical protein